MIDVRRCGDRNALAAFLLPTCRDELRRELPSLSLTPELLSSALASWDIVEFFDAQKGVIVGAAAREPSRYVHIYVDSRRRTSWAPHTSLQAALDIFLSDSESLYAGIPVANKITLSMARKLGFIHTSTKNSIAFHVLTRLTRKRFRQHGIAAVA
jgi:hypothetical protein